MSTDEKHPYIVGFTKNGLVKKSEKSIFVGTTQNKNGLKAATLVDGDEYIDWYESNGDYACLFTRNNYLIQFSLEEVNPVGKTARGVKAITLSDKDYVIRSFVYNLPVDKIELKRYNITIENVKLQKRAGKGMKIVSIPW